MRLVLELCAGNPFGCCVLSMSRLHYSMTRTRSRHVTPYHVGCDGFLKAASFSIGWCHLAVTRSNTTWHA